jgi:hypothetical protein
METLVSYIQFLLLMRGCRRNELLTTLLSRHLVSVIVCALPGIYLLAAREANSRQFVPSLLVE